METENIKTNETDADTQEGRRRVKKTPTANIYQKLSSITNALIGESEDIINKIKKLECEYGIYSYPVSKVIENGIIITVYRFVNIEKTDEFVETSVISSVCDKIDLSNQSALRQMYKQFGVCKTENKTSSNQSDNKTSSNQSEPKKSDIDFEKPFGWSSRWREN